MDPSCPTLLDISRLCSDSQEMARKYVARLHWAEEQFGPWPADEKDDRDLAQMSWEEAADLTTYLVRFQLQQQRARRKLEDTLGGWPGLPEEAGP